MNRMERQKEYSSENLMEGQRGARAQCLLRDNSNKITNSSTIIKQKLRIIYITRHYC